MTVDSMVKAKEEKAEGIKDNKLFFVDFLSDKKYTYSDLFESIKKNRVVYKFVYTRDYYVIFLNILTSLVHNIPVVLLDFDFSNEELTKLGITAKDLQTKITVPNAKEISDAQLIEKFKNDDWTISLYTSGTTGLPKQVKHNIKSLTRTARISEERKKDIWGFAYNPTHIAGLQVFFQALLNMNSIINLFGVARSKIFELIEEFEITNLSATPTFLRMLLPYERPFSSVWRITSGGERFDNKLAGSLSKMFPNAKVLNIYASTEAGTIFAAKGDFFEIKEENKNYIKIEDNELLIHRELLGFSESFDIVDDWYRTGDMVEFVDNSPYEFRFVGRKNEMINIGGYKVNPLEVEQSINLHPSVIASKVYGKKNSVLGNILIADVKVKNELDEKALKLFLKERLQVFKIPRIVNFVETIELTRTGKLKRS